MQAGSPRGLLDIERAPRQVKNLPGRRALFAFRRGDGLSLPLADNAFEDNPELLIRGDGVQLCQGHGVTVAHTRTFLPLPQVVQPGGDTASGGAFQICVHAALCGGDAEAADIAKLLDGRVRVGDPVVGGGTGKNFHGGIHLGLQGGGLGLHFIHALFHVHQDLGLGGEKLGRGHGPGRFHGVGAGAAEGGEDFVCHPAFEVLGFGFSGSEDCII